MKTHYLLIVIATLFFVAACSEKNENPTKSQSKEPIILNRIEPSEFETGAQVLLYGKEFKTSDNGGYALFDDIPVNITWYYSSENIGVIAPPNAEDGYIRVVVNQDTSNALPYKIKKGVKQKPFDYKLLLSKVTKVIIYAQFFNKKEDTLVYEINLNERFAFDSDVIKLSVDTISNAVKIIIPKLGGSYYEIWDGPPCDTSQKRRHYESYRYYDIPIKTTTENEFIAHLEGVVGWIHIVEAGYTIEWHNTGRYCYPHNSVDQPPLKGSVKIIFQCK